MTFSAVSVEDRLAIHDLFARYAWALDTGDVKGYGACFTEDTVVTEDVFEEPDIWRGRAMAEALAERFRNVPNFPGRQHHVGQILIEPDGVDRWKVKSFTFATDCKGEPPYIIIFAGCYYDVVVKLDGEYMFKERYMTLWDGEQLKNFPGHGARVGHKRPPELVVKR